MYRFGAAPSEDAMRAFARIREVYGIRRTELNESERTIRVEYDATRLTDPIVLQLLRRTGIDIRERVSLLPPQPEPVVAAPVAS
jgi:hypothetical protein